MLRIDYDELDVNEDHTLYMYEGELFTGIAYELWPNGTLRSETSYVDGAEDGISRDWSENGILIAEKHLVFNWLHGPFRKWYENGQLQCEKEVELGTILWEKEWSEDGVLIKHFVLKESDREWETLQINRRWLGPKLEARAPGRHIP